MVFMRMSCKFPYQGHLEKADVFGYTTKGIPGIEIVGLGKHGRQMKEKFIYLSKERGIRYPHLRYILCVEGEIEGKKFKNEEFRYLELPLLLMLWKMADVLPIYELTDCFAAGKISIQGEIDYLQLPLKTQEHLFHELGQESVGIPKLIAPRQMPVSPDFGHIHLEELLGPTFRENLHA
ncbi:MAG: hypothetical protein L6Q33_03605 [Bacteriovoracaceae bacterium]|nr:hypothetical protein [Bacteriovoracaceae bacterium]